MSGMGFCSSCLLVVGAIQQLYYKSPVMSQLFGEGIDRQSDKDLDSCHGYSAYQSAAESRTLSSDR
jgi:hypothetical protein